MVGVVFMLLSSPASSFLPAPQLLHACGYTVATQNFGRGWRDVIVSNRRPLVVLDRFMPGHLAFLQCGPSIGVHEDAVLLDGKWIDHLAPMDVIEDPVSLLRQHSSSGWAATMHPL